MMSQQDNTLSSLTDAELEAHLEKIQQNITLTLQAIDQNFETCNQIVSGTIIPEVEKCTKASREIWERSKSWLYFFQLQAAGAMSHAQEPENITNRPPFPHTTSNTTTMDHTNPTSTLFNPWGRLHRDLNQHRGTTSEQVSAGTDTVKGIFHRPLVARGIPSSSDITSTQSSSIYAPTTRPFGRDDDMDSFNSSSKDEPMDNDNLSMIDRGDQQSTPTSRPPMKHTTPHSTFTSTPTTNKDGSSRNIVEKGKSVDTSAKMDRFGENPMLQQHGSTKRTTLMDRLDEAQQKPLSATDIDADDAYHRRHQHQHYIKGTPGPTSYNGNSNTNIPSSSDPLANTPTVERVLKNYNKDYRNPSKRSRLMEDTDLNTTIPPVDPSAAQLSTPDTTKGKATTTERFPSPFFAVPTQHVAQGNQDSKGTDQLRDSKDINNSGDTPFYETPFWTSRTHQDKNTEFIQPRSRHHEPTAISTLQQRPLSTSNQLAPSPSPFTTNHNGNNNNGGVGGNDDDDDDMEMAYEFSPLMTRQQPLEGNDNESGRLTPHSQHSHASGHTTVDSTTSSVMTMMSGISGQIPARFALHYFPETFRNPPASVRLTKLYNLFADRPGEMLRWRQVVDMMREDQTEEDEMLLHQDTIKLLLDVLTRKRFVRRLEKGWTLRR